MHQYIVETDVLEANLRYLLEQAGDAAFYAVVKGNGYGLGLEALSRFLWDHGVTRFAVTEVPEVRALRQAFPEAEILMLRETGIPEELEALIGLDAVLTLGTVSTAEGAAQTAERLNKTAVCHLKTDTGMGRYGFLPDQAGTAARIYGLPRIQVAGCYTHFHSAFSDERETRRQFADFQRFLDGLTAMGLPPGLRHCCNSSALLKYPEMRLDGVRAGSALLGRLSFSGDDPLKPVGFCETRVEVLRQIPRGHTVGYGAGWKAKRDTTIAVCGVGYYHGFGTPRANDLYRFRDCLSAALSAGKAFVKKQALYGTVNGKPARVLGHVGMVQTILDVTDIPCSVGDPIRLEVKPLMVKDMEIVYR